MAIIDKDAQADEALTFKHFFMSELIIRQKEIKNVGDAPVYDVFITHKMAAHSATGEIFYRLKPELLPIKDYLSVAMQRAVESGNTAMIEALTAIETGVVDILRELNGMNVESV